MGKWGSALGLHSTRTFHPSIYRMGGWEMGVCSFRYLYSNMLCKSPFLLIFIGLLGLEKTWKCYMMGITHYQKLIDGYKSLMGFCFSFPFFSFFDSFLLPSYFLGNQRLFHHPLGLVGLFVKLLKIENLGFTKPWFRVLTIS